LSDVTPGSPAEKGGLNRGDIVLKLNGQIMDSSARFRNAVAVAGPKAEVSIELVRHGETKRVTVRLGEKDSTDHVAKLSANDDKMSGLSLAEPTAELRRRYEIPFGVQGAIVTYVETGSTAARAGFRPGDVIMELNRQRLLNVSDFAEAYRRARGTVAVLIYRQGNSLYLAFRK
jgi:serine protease Do